MMQEPRFTELEERSRQAGLKDMFAKLEDETRVKQVIEEMKAEDKVLVLTEEEENMLRSFRRFKLRMRKHGEVFKWQTRMPEGVQIAEDTGQIVHPSEGRSDRP
jgi:hypothetical protein